MTLGVVGIVLSLAMIVLIWVGRGMADQALTSYSAAIDSRLERVSTAFGALGGRLDAVGEGGARDALAERLAQEPASVRLAIQGALQLLERGRDGGDAASSAPVAAAQRLAGGLGAL